MKYRRKHQHRGGSNGVAYQCGIVKITSENAASRRRGGINEMAALSALMAWQ